MFALQNTFHFCLELSKAYLSGGRNLSGLLALPLITLLGTNALAYLSGAAVTKEKSFITLTSGRPCHEPVRDRKIPGYHHINILRA